MSKVSRTIMMIALAAALALGLVVSGCPGQPATNGGTNGSPEIGKPAPDFKLDTLDGRTVVLSRLQGTPVLVNFWATWCGPCRSEMPFLQLTHQNWPADKLVLLAVDVAENSSQVSQFMASAGFSFTVLLDRQAAVAQSYNVTGIPTTIFIDKEGVIQDIHVGAFQSQAEIETILDQLD
jgi:thiol-disulfide isomerase/thioredoxin